MNNPVDSTPENLRGFSAAHQAADLLIHYVRGGLKNPEFLGFAEEALRLMDESSSLDNPWPALCGYTLRELCAELKKAESG